MAFHPARIAQQEARLLRRGVWPNETLPHYSLSDTRALTAQIAALEQEDGSFARQLLEEEQRFVGAVSLRITYDTPYFLQAFTWIDQEGHGLRPLYPLWESQQFVLDRLAELEWQHAQDRSPDGLLLNVLKVRQVGVTTFGVACVTHRVLSTPYTRALVGSDIESQAGYLFRMAERIYTHLPWFLRPGGVTFTKDRERVLTNGSSLRTAWGKTTRGALQEVGGTKGNIERGRTYPVVHISELATWDNPEQLDTALLPGIPVSPSTLVIFESTAELAGDWWNRHWDAAKGGEGRFANLFLPNYAVPSKYSLPPPAGWAPADTTKAWLQKAERESPTWCGGQTIRPTPAQAYWYESTRAYYEKKGDLAGFLREYPSDDEECFQYAGTQILTLEQHERLAAAARPLLDVWAVEPSREIAELRRMQPVEPGDVGRRPPPISLRLPPRAPESAYPVPPGYGFRRLPPTELQTLLTGQGLRGNVLAIWEYPRSRGPRAYILGVDVAYGVGGDASVISVVRQPTLEEPAEEVAQYVSHHITPAQLAWIVDAIGHLYPDQEGIEALAAIECNMGPGLSTQDTLQLHLGYTHFYVWEYANARDAERRYSTRIGWYTTPQTRPILVSKFLEAVTAEDAISGSADFRLNSPTTRSELRHLVIPPGGTLGDAAAALGHHDDAIIASGIGYYVAYRLAGGEAEPIDERRKRRAALVAYHQTLGEGARRDWRNSDIQADQIPDGGSDARDEDDDDLSYDERSHDW